MNSTLPITGHCHYCNKPTLYRFCRGTSCQRLYWYHKQNPQAQHRSRKPQGNTTWTPRGGTLEDRINAIVQRAQATADAMLPGRDAFYRGGLSIKGSRL